MSGSQQKTGTGTPSLGVNVKTMAFLFVCALFAFVTVSYLSAGLLKAHRASLRFAVPERTQPCVDNYTSAIPKDANATMGYLTIGYKGRLGNTLFQYASLIGLAKRNNKIPLLNVPKHKPGSAFYDTLNLRHVDKEQKKNLTWNHVTETGWAKVAKHIIDLKAGNFVLNGYMCSWKYFESAIPEILEDFTPPCKLRKEVDKVIDQISARFPDHVLIGVHVRRGDFIRPYFQKFGYAIPPLSYFQKAFNYMAEKFKGKKPVFVIASNGMKWCKENLNKTGYPVHFLGPGAPINDMLILARTKHVVVSSGSFGWWAAWLAGGWGKQTGSIIVYFNGYPKTGSPIYKGYTKDDYYPRHWVGLGI